MAIADLRPPEPVVAAPPPQPAPPRPKPGRPSERDERTEAILQAIRNGAQTRRQGAAFTTRLDKWGNETADYKDDVRAAGGWQALKVRARGEGVVS